MLNSRASKFAHTTENKVLANNSEFTVPRLIWDFAGRTVHFVGFVLLWLNLKKYNKTYKMAYLACQDSDQPVYPYSIIWVYCPDEETLGPWLSTECQVKDSHQTGAAVMHIFYAYMSL